MDINLSSELARYVAEQIQGGKFADESAVVCEALSVMKRVQEMLPSAQDDLRREIDEGLLDVDEGRLAEWDVEETKRRLIERMKARKAS